MRAPFRLICRLTHPIGLALSELILFTVYAFVFVPIALILRLTNNRPLALRPDRDQPSYWQPAGHRSSFDRPFKQY